MKGGIAYLIWGQAVDSETWELALWMSPPQADFHDTHPDAAFQRWPHVGEGAVIPLWANL